MCINVDKSKIVVFRNEGKVKLNEKWFIINDVLEIVKQFTYLEYSNAVLNLQKQLSDQGRKTMFALRKNIRGIKIHKSTK